MQASERDEGKRLSFRARISRLTTKRLIFLDEMGSNTSLARLYARAPRGMRVVGSVPRNYGESVSVIGAVGLRGIVAAMTLDGAVDRLAFEAFVEQILAPQLQHGDILVLDNLSVHRSSDVERMVGRVGAQVVWLPPYSPDFSPIENCWSKIKSYLRGAKARTRELLEQAIGEAFKTVTMQDLKGWFTHCGYKVTS